MRPVWSSCITPTACHHSGKSDVDRGHWLLLSLAQSMLSTMVKPPTPAPIRWLLDHGARGDLSGRQWQPGPLPKRPQLRAAGSGQMAQDPPSCHHSASDHALTNAMGQHLLRGHPDKGPNCRWALLTYERQVQTLSHHLVLVSALPLGTLFPTTVSGKCNKKKNDVFYSVQRTLLHSTAWGRAGGKVKKPTCF